MFFVIINTMNIKLKNTLRTWIEVDKKAIYHNIAEFRKIIKPDVKLMAIVKSNAYGHGLVDFAQTVENKVDWFGVDSITEGLKLRQKGMKKPVFVLGYTLPARVEDATQNDISLSVSTLNSLRHLATLKNPPKVHLKIDTGMHRQGFFIKDLPKVLKILKSNSNIKLEGIYSHLAAAKDRLYPSVSLQQIKEFKKADEILKGCGKNYLRHICASAGTILYPEAHFDLVRIGKGSYGMFPTHEIKIQSNIKLKPALTWKSIISEIKDLPSGSFIGYDLTEKVLKSSKIAIIPIGYWHGFDRGLSSIGEVLIKNERCKILGRVSMDMIIINVSNIKNIKVGDEVIILGGSKKGIINVEEIARKAGTINDEIVTRINPLIKRFYI